MENNTQELRVIGARMDTKMVVLYLEDGGELIIKQGDHRLKDLLDAVVPITTRGETAVINLHDFSIYSAFERKSEGLTKFFKMAKSKVRGFFGGNTDTHETIISDETKEAVLKAVRHETMTEAEVTEHGQPVDASDEIDEKEEVIVAVVTTPATETEPEKKTVIPGVHMIKPLINHAVKTNSPEAVQNFLRRCAAFINERGHTVDDLMRFLEKGDLPLADDGSIIAYKMLNSFGGNGEVFVDCHSGKIQQRVGSYVCVNENLVDLNRRNECSNGLHIARRSYLRNFSGDVCVLCKIDPEDVMVVPHNDANKVRVKGYHILAKLSEEAKGLLKSGKPITGQEDALSDVFRAIKGDHIARIERVQVNGQMGSNVVTTALKYDKSLSVNRDYNGKDMKSAAALDDETNIVGAIDPREVNKRVLEEHAKIHQEAEDQGVEPDDSTAEQDTETYHTQEATKLAGKTGHVIVGDEISEIEKIEKDLDVKAAQAILDRKKKAKKSWEKLGYPSNTGDRLQAIVKLEADTAPEPKTDFPGSHVEDKGWPKDKPKKETSLMEDAMNTGTPHTEALKPAPIKTAAPTKADQARAMYDDWQNCKDRTGKENRLAKLKDFKKSVKKGWAALGFNPREIDKIEGK